MSTDRVAELPLPGGITCCVPENNALLTPFVLREQGDWFEDEIAFVRRLVEPGQHVIDIGANFGTYTLSMAARVGSGGRVISFEPAKVPRTMLKRSLAKNAFTWVDLHEAGLSNHDGGGSLATSINSELNSLSGEQTGSETIRLLTLDGCLGEYPHRISFIKMDAEGEEERILEGAGRFLARNDPVVMFELKHGATINEGLCEAFLRRGFLIYRLLPGVGALTPVPIGQQLDGFLLNVFAVRPSAEAELMRRGMLVPLRVEIPEAVKQLKVQETIAALASAPWMSGFAHIWAPDPAVPGWEDQRRAVALASHADRKDIDAAGRTACLQMALQSARKAMTQGVTGSRIFTLARIALDLGFRAESLPGVTQLVQMAMDGKDLSGAFKEPFLLPLRQHESLHGLSLQDLTFIATLETYLWKAAFSVYFIGEPIVPVLERACSSAHSDARTKRTLALVQDRRRLDLMNRAAEL